MGFFVVGSELNAYICSIMKLLQLSYNNPDWSIQNLQLGSTNLLVGRNAVGKSRTLSLIHLLAQVITQKQDLAEECDWDLLFENENKDQIRYQITCKISDTPLPFLNNTIITFEAIYINEIAVLQRNTSTAAKIKSVNNVDELLHLPPNKLTINARRDIKAYPFLEDIMNWAEQIYLIDFTAIDTYKTNGHPNSSINTIPFLYKNLNQDSQEGIIKTLQDIGYSISTIKPQYRDDYLFLLITETGLKKALKHSQLSQGMYRALSILILIEYLSTYVKTSSILIDDFCEGLDYDRATKLGKIIFDKCQNQDIQLIASSNDSFLMDVVDIKYWNVLDRSGDVVTSLNYQSHPTIFEQFRFTGMSNFDFFASDYIKQKIQ